ncbi:MAG: restriction endonuclease subunit S [Candidatus Marinimicrobia bacterium]|nr:restriction endonuclease subunit S [Candidatus Neomarinimicrobiota bacterium]
MSNLPIGWAYLSLGEISQRITKGSTPTSYGFTYKDSGIKFIKTENIDQNGNIDGKTAYIDEATNLFLKRSILRKKDILFSIAGTIGRVGVVKGNNLPANTNQALAIIRLYHDFSYQRYVFYLLRSKIIQNQAKGSKVGVGRANVSLTDVSNFRIPLPPLPEQQRIVARIEELFTKLDAGVDALQKAKALLKQYRQSVLKAAVEGRLTEKWRTENGLNLYRCFWNGFRQSASCAWAVSTSRQNPSTQSICRNCRMGGCG